MSKNASETRWPAAAIIGGPGDGKTESMITRLSLLESSVTRLATLISSTSAKSPAEHHASASPAELQNNAAGVGSSGARTQGGTSPADNPKRGEQDLPVPDRPSKRRRVGSEEQPRGEEDEESESNEEINGDPKKCPPEQDFSRASAIEAQNFIQGELADGAHNISTERRGVLESALRFIGQMSHSPYQSLTSLGAAICPADMSDALIPPSPELLHLMLSGSKEWLKSRTDADSNKAWPASTYDLQFSTFVSRETLERMNLALVNESEDQTTLMYHAVCVNTFVYSSLAKRCDKNESAAMHQALEKSQGAYLRRAITAMKYISILATPSLPLLQALLSGATLLQKLGDTPKCWTLTATAGRICIALGLHHPQNLGPPLSESPIQEKEARSCFLWCFILDKGLSMSLGRPVSLPVWDVPEDIVAPVDPDRPFSAFIAILLQFAKVQATIICDLDFQPSQPNSPQRRQATIASLKEHMSQIRLQMSEYRAFPSPSSGVDYISEWTSLDFVYHAIMTVILRFDGSVVTDAIKREECLDNARKAFIALRNLKNYLATSLNNADGFASFLPWTVLYYPLRPYFVLFCNVVATSHAGDFELMKEFANTLMDLPNLNQSGVRLQKLCATLVGLCAPLIIQQHAKDGGAGQQHQQHHTPLEATGDANNAESSSSSSAGDAGPAAAAAPDARVFSNGVMGDGGVPMVIPEMSRAASAMPWFQPSLVVANNPAAVMSVGQQQQQVGADAGWQSSSSEEMFNALFDVQPSLDWLGAEVFSQNGSWMNFDNAFGMN